MESSKIIALKKIHDDDVQKAVFEALETINAKSLMVKEGMKILLKPNLLSAKPPERAVTTHPTIVRAVIRWLKQFKPAKIYVGDSSGGTAPNKTLECLKASGLQAVCDEEGVIALPLEKTKRVIYQVPNPLVLKEFASTSLLGEVDLIVNLPKIKTHNQCTLTCCIKNMFGTILLGNKPRMHAQFTGLHEFTAALVDVYSVSHPQLTIVDGYLCQEGNGPGAGDVVKMDLILAGYDGVALDALVCKITQIDVKDILYLQKAHDNNIGSMDLSEFEIKGEKISDITRKFKLPKISVPKNIPIPKFITRYAAKTLFRSQITIDKSKCQLCGTCWRDCPVDALESPKPLKIGETVPLWDSKKCIACYCCSELCPYEAIEFEINVKRNFLKSWLFGGCVVAVALIIFAIILL